MHHTHCAPTVHTPHPPHPHSGHTWHTTTSASTGPTPPTTTTTTHHHCTVLPPPPHTVSSLVIVHCTPPPPFILPPSLPLFPPHHNHHHHHFFFSFFLFVSYSLRLSSFSSIIPSVTPLHPTDNLTPPRPPASLLFARFHQPTIRFARAHIRINQSINHTATSAFPAPFPLHHPQPSTHNSQLTTATTITSSSHLLLFLRPHRSTPPNDNLPTTPPHQSSRSLNHHKARTISTLPLSIS